MQLRPPSIDQGVQAGAWAIGLGLFLFFGMLAIEVERASALIFSVVAAGVIFFFVRLRGEEDLR
jgi:hypothetical protein